METLCLPRPWLTTSIRLRLRTLDIRLLVAVVLVLVLVAPAILAEGGSAVAGGAPWLPEWMPFDAAMSMRPSIRLGTVTLTLGWPW